jgi:hypothetical protein
MQDPKLVNARRSPAHIQGTPLIHSLWIPLPRAPFPDYYGDLSLPNGRGLAG